MKKQELSKRFLMAAMKEQSADSFAKYDDATKEKVYAASLEGFKTSNGKSGFSRHTMNLAFDAACQTLSALMKRQQNNLLIAAEIGPTAFMLLCYFQNVADDRGYVETVMKEIETDLGLTYPTVKTAIATLVEAKKIECRDVGTIGKRKPRYSIRLI